MTGVIYARYSSDNQREESIEGQVRDCKAFAEKNGIQILGTYIDRAMSAKTDNRPDFQRMIKDSAKGMFDTVVVWKLDRFARNRYDSAHYKSILKKNRVRVVSATEAISDSPEGILMESLLEGYAEYYSAELAQEVTRGMTDNALKGKYNGGMLPVGYRIDTDQHFQIDPLSAPLVIQAFERYANGEAMAKVTDFLNDSGIRTARHSPMTINSTTRMLHNRRYLGEYVFKDISVPDAIPPIITKELFDRVQARMARTKKAPAQHKAEDDYILTTKLRCGKCKCFMVGESGTSQSEKNVHHYYKCVSVKYHKGCDKKTVRKDWIEDIVLRQIQQLVMDDEWIEKLADMLEKELSKENDAIPVLKKELIGIERSIENMLNAIQNGIFTASTKERLESLEEQKKALNQRIAEEELAKPQISRDTFITWIRHFQTYDIQDKEQRQRLVDHFVNVIYLYEDHFDIYLNFREGAINVPFDEDMLKSAKSRKPKKSNISSDMTPQGAPKAEGHPKGCPSAFVQEIGFRSICRICATAVKGLTK